MTERDPAELIGQALRAQVGGSTASGPMTAPGSRPSLSTAQVLLIAAIIGLVVGMGAGFVILLA